MAVALESVSTIDTGVAIKGVSRTFHVDGREVVALRDVSLAVRSGEFVSLLGPSGCGKSTLLRIVAGLDQPDAGKCVVEGAIVRSPSLSRGVVFQDHRLLPWLTVRENILLALHKAPLEPGGREARVRELLDLVGLSGFAGAKPHQLSGGMSQRAAIARALAPRPRLLLLDEPLGALDSLTRSRLQSELLRLWEHDKVTVIMVTHDVEEAVYLSNRVIVMEPRPGRVRATFNVAIPYPRRRADMDFVALRQSILDVLEREATAAELA